MLSETAAKSSYRAFWFHGTSYRIYRQVFPADEFGSTKFFSERLAIYELGRFLEIGSGAGVTVAHLVKTGAAKKAVAVDINRHAVNNTQINVQRAGVANKVDVHESDIFKAVTGKFDTIYWNSPFINSSYAGTSGRLLEHALFDPGFLAHKRFFKHVFSHLKPGGQIFIGRAHV